jgi:hypothetical protein
MINVLLSFSHLREYEIAFTLLVPVQRGQSQLV